METCDPNLTEKGPAWARGQGFIAGYAVQAEGYSNYFPIRHQGGGNLDAKKTTQWMKDISGGTSRKIFFNAPYDLGWLAEEGIQVNGPIECTMLGASLLDENRKSYSLDNIARDFAGVRKDETLLRSAAQAYGIDPKKDLWKLPARYVGAYGIGDVEATTALREVEIERLEKEELMDLFRMECALLQHLVRAKRKGIRVDEAKVDELGRYLDIRYSEELNQIQQSFGLSIDVWSGDSIKQAFEESNLTFPTTKLGNPSFTKLFLASHDHPLPKAIVAARRYSNIKSLVCDGMMSYLHNGRIHCELHSFKKDRGGTVSGRFSSSNPNLQQVPSRDPELGPMCRALFRPEAGESWIKLDYSQQEYRLIVHYAHRMGYPGAREALRRYSEEGADFHQIVADLCGIDRRPAKDLNFGMAYGLGQEKLARSLGVSMERAQEIIDRYHSNAPFMRMLSDACRRRASKLGEIKTILGRHCRFPMWELHEYDSDTKPKLLAEAQQAWPDRPLRRAFTHKAMNRLIQGSAADMTKKAFLDAAEAGYLPIIQIHDELAFSSGQPEKEEPIINEIMVQALPLDLPVKVDGGWGPNWAEAT